MKQLVDAAATFAPLAALDGLPGATAPMVERHSRPLVLAAFSPPPVSAQQGALPLA